MRLISIDEIMGNEIVARNVVDSSARVLLSSGMTLQPSYINRLYDMGITEVYIEDEISEGVVVDDVVLKETRIEAKKIISTEAKRLLTSKEINVMEIYKIIDLLINDILNNKELLLNVKDLRIKDECTFSHSVNTAILAGILCKKLGYNYEKISNIVTGCILHDIGKIFFPKDIMNTPEEQLSGAELELFKSHPRIGYELLKDRVEIKPTVKMIILTHHERLNGSGFPEGVEEGKLQDGAKICAICDAFDNTLNAPSKSGFLCTTKAVELIHTCSYTLFDAEMAAILLKHIPIYPVGTIVLMDNGFLGIVIKNHPLNMLRPVVRVFYDSNSKVKINNREIDLLVDLSARIEREVKVNSNKEIVE